MIKIVKLYIEMLITYSNLITDDLQFDQNCVYINIHGIHTRSCLSSDTAAICGTKGNQFVW